MSAAKLQLTIRFTVIHCCNAACGTPIAMPTQVYERFRADPSQWFCCCFGHRQHFSGPTELERKAARLEQELSRERESKQWWQKKADQHSKSASAFKGQVTRIRNRVGNGVCPCCNRSFQNLQRHMSTQHPDYAKAEPTEKDPP